MDCTSYWEFLRSACQSKAATEMKTSLLRPYPNPGREFTLNDRQLDASSDEIR
jgi:hypothetical protein